jgi:hypothetical protein
VSATLEAGPPLQVGTRWIIPVWSMLRVRPSPRSVLLDKSPEAVVVVDHDGTQALALDGTERELGDLCARVPGLRAIVTSLSGAPRCGAGA